MFLKFSYLFFLNTVFVLLAITGFFVYWLSGPFSNSSSLVTLTQIAPHPSLDQIRQGIEDESKTVEGLKIVYENAQGNITIATQIAKRFLSLKSNVIVPITTPSAQSIYNLTTNNTPVVFSGVSDPISAKLTRKGITGVSDLSPVKKQVEFILALLPNTKTIGILYNPGEVNSMTLVSLFAKEAYNVGLNVIKAPRPHISEMSTAFKSIEAKVDVLYIPNDNTVVTALDTVLQLARQSKISVFASDPESVSKGCLGALSYDQYQVGRQTGRLVIRILKGEDINHLPIEYVQKLTLYFNQQVAKDLGAVIPEDLAKHLNIQH